MAVTSNHPVNNGVGPPSSNNNNNESTTSKADSYTISSGGPTEWKKFTEYDLEVDPAQYDRAREIRLCSFTRPHMRAFHLSWWSFFMAFFIWFSIAPLLGEIRDDLGLSNQDIWTSNIFGVGGTIFMRLMLGPLCDMYGARILFSLCLTTASIPTACTGFTNTAMGLSILRLFIGIAGGTFVTCQYWTSTMFANEVVGTANAVVAGWGNLGGGVTQLVMGSLLFPLFKVIFRGNSETAWRTVCIVPAVVSFTTGVLIYFISDDAPRGNYTEMKKHGVFPKDISFWTHFKRGLANLNTWMLFLQYACCFGVELTMNNAAALYFRDEFGQNTEAAAAIASIFGWMNLFARSIGGLTTDWASAKLKMRGRLIVQTMFLAFEGVFVLIFANSKSLGGAIVVMTFFSLFVQAAEGSTYGIVPFVDPPATGAISGFVGAGGNVGAVAFGLAFRQLDYEDAFVVMGATILCGSILSGFINIKGHQTMY